MHAPLPRPDPAGLIAWYDRHARVLPWRARPGEPAEPYRVWLSEVMLQQTTVKAAIPYFHAFTTRWPTVESLAAARDEEVMAAWAGLGYYARARKLLECARVVAGAHSGRFPDQEDALRALPGIGPYTAAAVAAIAFGRRAVVVDGNVERVIARLFAVDAPLPGAKGAIRALAATLTPLDRPGDYAQAVMDLGATLCIPRRPACGLCPWRGACRAAARGDPATFPRKSAKAARPLRRGVAFWVTRGDEVLLRRRPPKGLLGGMTEVPCTPWSETFDLAEAATHAPIAGLAWRTLAGAATHGFTHFELEVTVMAAAAAPGTPAPDGHWWHPTADLARAGLPTAMAKIARQAGVQVTRHQRRPPRP